MAGRCNILRVLSFSTIAFCAGAIGAPAVSTAGNGFGMAMAIMGMMRHGGGGGGHRHRHGGGGGGGDGERHASSRQDSEAPDQKQANENAVLFVEAYHKIDQNQKTERNRNVSLAIEDFIDVLEDQHRKLRNVKDANVRASTGSNINQITEGEIRVAAEKAYQEAHLTDFDLLAGELWTRDRLEVQILVEAQTGILPYFHGVGAKGPDMNNLQEVFKEAAANVYARALELAEIVGVSRSFDHFIRTIYENSDQVPAGLQTVGADVQYERMLTRVIDNLDHSFFVAGRVDSEKAANLSVRLAHQFGFRFRARRALYDCLSASYVSLINDGAAVPAQLAPAPNGGRGAAIDGLPLSQANNGPAVSGNADVESLAGNGDGSENVWKRTRKVVGEKCKEIAQPFAQSALAAGLKPISARADLAVSAGLAPDRAEGQYLQIRTDEPR